MEIRGHLYLLLLQSLLSQPLLIYSLPKCTSSVALCGTWLLPPWSCEYRWLITAVNLICLVSSVMCSAIPIIPGHDSHPCQQSEEEAIEIDSHRPCPVTSWAGICVHAGMWSINGQDPPPTRCWTSTPRPNHKHGRYLLLPGAYHPKSWQMGNPQGYCNLLSRTWQTKDRWEGHSCQLTHHQQPGTASPGWRQPPPCPAPR